MGFELDAFSDARIDADYLEWLVDVHSVTIHKHFSKLWDYYANPAVEAAGGAAAQHKIGESGRSYVQAQEAGLPVRITGLARRSHFGAFDARAVKDIQRKEVVIENDIAWRVNAAADFLFGKPINIVSKAPDGRRRSEIEAILRAVFAANGGLGFFQDMAVLGSVYGFVDCVVRPAPSITDLHIKSHSDRTCSIATVLQLAQAIGLELIEAPRALPVLDEDDYRVITHYVQHFCQKKNAVGKNNSSA